MSKELISQTLAGFDVYIRTAIPYLLTLEGADERFKRLGVTQVEMDAAEAHHDEWWTGNPATPGIYELHSNEATKNKVTRRGVERIMGAFTPAFSNLLKRMSTMTYTDTDKATLNIPERDTVLTSRGPITDSPVVGVKAIGAGKVKLTVKIAADSDRPSMHPLADAIKVVYIIGTTAPATPQDCTEDSRSTKAIFDLATGNGNEGKKIYGFVNYVNDTKPANDGPPSTMFSVMIS